MSACSLSTRSRFQLFAAVVFTLGACSMFFEGVTICQRAYDENSMVRHGVKLVNYYAMGDATAFDDTPSPTPAPTPTPFFASELERKCFYTHDVGLISEIQANMQVFCARRDRNDPATRTKVSYVDLTSRGIAMRAMVFGRDLQLDFSQAVIHHPIASLAEDGGYHDPRFNWNPSMISCSCSEFQQYADNTTSSSQTPLHPWEPVLAGTPENHDDSSTVCGGTQLDTTTTKATSTLSSIVTTSLRTSPPLVTIHEKTILIARRDDHNPFFQISSALNAWLLMRTLGWNRDHVRVIHMDGGYPSPIDMLHHRLLSSPLKHDLLSGQEHLMGKKLRFTNEVLVATYETSGPMMQHLDDDEPCQQSQLFKEFRTVALETMGVVAGSVEDTQHIVVTIITRRNYGGRTVQRRWLNENEVVAAMRETYRDHKGVPILIQSVDYVELPLQQQMEITLQSDVVIGMHGAGMVNVLWTKPETLVVEIFPRQRRRWGYRNLCQHVGCDWHEFRGGNDTGNGDNASDKTIPVETWREFFDPLFRHFLEKVIDAKFAFKAEAATTNVDQRMRQ